MKRKIVIRGISLADQLFFSAGNFVLMMLLARYYDETELAGFGIGLSIALIIQGIQRNCYIVQNAILTPKVFKSRAARVLGQHLIAWAIVITCSVAVSGVLILINNSAYSWAILYSTIVCSLIYAQLDFDRIYLIKHEKYLDACLASAFFLAMNGVLLFAVPRMHISFGLTMFFIGMYAVLKILRLVLITGMPDFSGGWQIGKINFRRYFPGAVLGMVGYTGFNHIPLFVLGSVAPPLQSAAFVAMRSLMQPLQVVIRSLDMIDKNFFHARLTNDPRSVRRALFQLLALYGTLALLAVSFLVYFAGPIIHLAYGAKYAAFSHILVGWGIIFGMLAISQPIETIIVREKKLNTYNLYRLGGGAVGAVAAFVLCPQFAATGAVMATLIGWIASIGCALWLIRDVLFDKTGFSWRLAKENPAS